MAVKVVEGKDYRILPDDYRLEFHKHNKPAKVIKKIVEGKVTIVKYYRCMYCGKLVPHYDMQVDHIIPKTRFMAGILWNPNKAWNLGASCPSCNISKSNYVDARVIKGFQNKLINKYGISRKIADMRGKDIDLKTETTSGDSETLEKFMPLIMVGVYSLTVLKPVIIVAAWLVQAIMWLGVRAFKIIKRVGGKLFRSIVKYLKKEIKYYIKQPKKLYKLAGKIALVALVIYALGVPVGGQALYLTIAKYAGSIWLWGTGVIQNALGL